MPKRKKYAKLPSGYGSIRYLGKGRRLPYAVHPPAAVRDTMGRYVRPKALCYVPDWYTGFAVLSAYHAGRYEPGMEMTISREVQQSSMDLDAFCLRVLKDHGMASNAEWVTLKDVYDQFIEWKFGENAPKKLSDSARGAYQQGWGYLSVYADRPISTLTIEHLQQVVNDCDKKKATRQNIVLTAKQIWKFAMSRDLVDNNPAQYLVVPDGRDDEHGVPLTDDELRILWKHKDDKTVAAALVMCYSGFRIGAFKTLEINLDEMYFRGGLKTAAGKNRIVPIHSSIIPLVKNLSKPIIPNDQNYRRALYPKLKELGISEHTPHDFRHTFSRLCEKYGVREADRKRLLGHSFGSDLTNGIYGHRTLDELRAEIEKIHPPE